MNRPTLDILIGLPGSGKSTYANLDYKFATVVSSDSIRKELYGDENIQGNPEEVFSLMRSRTLELLNQGKYVVYDATSMTRKDRASIIGVCPKFVRIRAIVVWASIETCIERDSKRERTVGKAVIDKMLKRFQAPYFDEGFEEIIVHRSEETNSDYVNKLIKDMDISHDNPHHTNNILQHCLEASKQFNIEDFNEEELYWAAKYHDIGKPYVKAFVDSKGEPCDTAHYYQHQCVGAWQSYGIFGNNSLWDARYIAWLISTHMDPYLNTKYYNKLPDYLKRDIDRLHKADLEAH